MHSYYAQPIYYTDVSKWCGSLTDWSISKLIVIDPLLSGDSVERSQMDAAEQVARSSDVLLVFYF